MSEVKKESWGAWKKTTKDGKEVINFTLNGKRYNMWVNSYKNEAKQPDYKIYEDTYVAPTEAKNAPVNNEIPKPIYNDDLEF